jgi:N-acetylglucosamine-6-phosphate deacetylase
MKKSLFDVQVNGFAGVDFQQSKLSAAEVRQAVDELAAHETCRFFATLITDSIDSLCAKLENFEHLRAVDPVVNAALCGYHIEGPWLSPEPGFRGAHDPRYMRSPDIGAFKQLQTAANGNIRLLTVAPEWPGSAAFIRQVVDMGVQVSLGHTNAADADIDAAIMAGSRFCTHLGNGVPVELHRHDNVVQRLLARDELIAFLIPDGIHLPPAVLKNFYHAKPEGQALFTTDCMAAAGAPSGRYRVGHWEVEVGEDRMVRMPGGAQFVGSELTPEMGVANIEKWLGLSPMSARQLFSTAVATVFGVALPDLTN